MLASYNDIRSRIKEEPQWFDSNGVPRYEPFSPELIPCIYANEAILYEIQCQNCEKPFMVADQRARFFEGSIADEIMRHQVHYGDPPRHDCTGDTMNCVDIRIVEYWHRPHAGEWTRVPELEVAIDVEQEAP